MAAVQRAVKNFLKLCRKQNNTDDVNRGIPLGIGELAKAKTYLIKVVQYEVYSEELKKALKKNESFQKKWSISSLSPYLDDKGIIRIRRRIDETIVLPVESRRLILMPCNQIASELIIRNYYELLHH